jgi:AraC family transcriptional regulator of adaptative response/methylated-DNA-[protein]-cysteine methyltransferase
MMPRLAAGVEKMPARAAVREPLSPATQDIFWRAVLTRDAKFDGAVFFAVRTTGIYCRPTCPARRPQRAHAQFFKSADEAERAGFRACRRCHPRRANRPDPRVALVLEACRTMQSADEEPLRLATLAARARMSPFHFHRLFRKITGLSPRQFAEAWRVREFRRSVRGGASVTTALYDAGFGSSSRLYEKAASHLGMTPATYRQGGTGAEIHFTIAPCPLGRLLVAGTRRGICAVRLGDSEQEVLASLRKEFPAAKISGANPRLRRWLEAILRHLDGRMPHLDLPLDIRATAFQRRVWQELRRIPYGATRSYREVAWRIGRPRAARAVARACASNPAALVIPCHRVVRASGEAGGYRWGRERKQLLLEHEKSRRARKSAQ